MQEYIPAYRRPLFERMREVGAARGIQIEVAAGSPTSGRNSRGDAVYPAWLVPVRQSEFDLGGRRLTFRRLPRHGAEHDLLVMEQARRNVDAYRRLAVPRRLRRRPVALWGHGADFIQVPSRLQADALAALTRRADWFFAYTELGRDAAVDAGQPRDRVTVLYNTVDTARLHDEIVALTDAERAAFAAEHRLAERTALFIGGLDEEKRLPFLIEAADAVASADPQFRLLVAGTGALDGMIRSAAETRPWLRPMGRAVGRDRALALDAAQLILMPGRVGLVAIDSFVAGAPIITTDFGRHAPEAEYLDWGRTALRTEDDPRAFAAAVSDLIGDPDRLAAMQEACRTAMAEFSIDAMAERFVDGIISCFDSHPRTAGRARLLRERVPAAAPGAA